MGRYDGTRADFFRSAAAHSGKLLRSKRGEEYVEAAIVIPLFILTVLGLILLMLFLYLSLGTQVNMHKNLVRQGEANKKVFTVVKAEEKESKKLQGIVGITMEKDIDGRYYGLNEARTVRIREGLQDSENE